MLGRVTQPDEPPERRSLPSVDLVIEHQLRENRRFLATLISNLPGVVYRCRNDERWTMEYLSDECEALTGYSRGEILENCGVAFADLIHEEDRDRIRDEVEARVEAGEPFQIEYRIVRRDGGMIWVCEHGRAVTRPDGVVVALEGYLFDVSDRKASERALAERNDQLARTQRIEALGELAAGVAHDFNNVLTAVTGYARLIADDGEVSEEHRGHAGEILVAAKRAAELTERLLALGRDEGFHPRVVDLDALVDRAAAFLDRVLRDDVRINLDPSAAPWSVHADPAQLERVLLNLAINAQHAMPEGGMISIVTEKVRLGEPEATRLSVKPGPHVALVVRDEGIGMTAEVRERAFEPFYTTRESGRGTGLGLAMAYTIVRQHGGAITLESEPGEGAMFTILLPRHESEEDDDPDDRPPERASGGDETILLVEDSDGVRTLLRSVLESAGYTVVETRSAGEASRRVEEGDPADLDLVVTDVVLPDRSGMLLVRDLQRALGRSIPAIAISGYQDVMDAEEVSAFLAKPFSTEELLATVRRVLDA